jgi:hypothetical protein
MTTEDAPTCLHQCLRCLSGNFQVSLSPCGDPAQYDLRQHGAENV